MKERRYDVDWLRLVATLAIFLFHWDEAKKDTIELMVQLTDTPYAMEG